MATILGYMSNDNSLTDVLMDQAREQGLRGLEEDLSCLGLGWLQDERTLERKYPRPEPGVDVLNLMGALNARTQLAHLKHSGPPNVNPIDVQPFRFRTWLYVQGEATPALEGLRDEINDSLPDFLRSYVKGSAVEEVAFYHALHHLFDQDVFHNAAVRAPDAARALGQGVVRLEEMLGRPFDQMHVMLATGRTTLGVSIGAPTQYRIWRGIEAPPEERIGSTTRPRPIPHPHFKGALIASGAPEMGQDWSALEGRHVFWLDQGWELGSDEI